MSYKFGTFVWIENHAKDVAAAKAFYTEVFGWGTAEMKMGDGSSYVMLTQEGKHVCGIVEPAKGASPRWLSYLSVPDVDQATRAAEGNGATVLAQPMALPGVGRMSVVVDPQGAPFALFKGEQSDDGATPVLHWNELWSPDAAAALPFYQKSFELSVEQMQMPAAGDSPYNILKHGEAATGGVMTPPGGTHGPANWVSFIEVSDTDATIERATARGGKVIAPPMDVEGIGRFSVFADPQGAVLGVIKPAR